MNTPRWLIAFLLISLLPSILYADDPPTIDPQMLAEVQKIKEAHDAASAQYYITIHNAMDRVLEQRDQLVKRLVKEELTTEQKEKIYKQIHELQIKYSELDADENVLQAATIVRWSNRKKDFAQFLSGIGEKLT